MKLKFHLSVYFVSLRPLSCVASDYSSGSVVWNGLLRPLRPLREIKIRTIVFHAKNAESAKFLFTFLFNAGAEGVANFVTTRVRREFIHPLPLRGTPPCLRGRVSYNRISPRQPIVPLRQVGRAKRRGWMFLAFPFNKPPSNVGNVVRSTNFSICGIKVLVTVTKCFKTRG